MPRPGIKRVLFMGSKSMGLKSLAEIYSRKPASIIGVMGLDDRDDSRSALPGFKEFCARQRLDLFLPADRRESEAIIRKLKPDLCIVVCWYWLLSGPLLKTVPGGFLGIHPSLLPRYRGGSPLVWSVIRGEKRVGATLFSFTDEMDAGDIWAQVSVPIQKKDGIGEILDRLEDRVRDLFRKNFLKILERRIKPWPQDHRKATYCAQRYPEHGRIDWKKSAAEIHDFIRAQSSPYPGAFTFLNDKKLILWKAAARNMIYYGTPGQVAKIDGEGVWVICGDHKPLILECVESGGKRGPAFAFIKTRRICF